MGMEKPLREGKVVKVIGEGDSKVIFMDSYIDYDPEAVFRNAKRIGDIILECAGSNMRVVDVKINPGRKSLFKVVDDD